MLARISLFVALVFALVSPAFAAPTPKAAPNTSWVGKTVLIRSHNASSYLEVSGQKPNATNLVDPLILEGIAYEVLEDLEKLVRVRDVVGNSLWVYKTELVPLDEAVAAYTLLLAAEPQNNERYNLRGWAHHLSGNDKEALADLNEYVKRQPNDALGFSNRGVVLGSLGLFGKAAESYREALRLDPRYLPISVNLGTMYEAMGEYDKAMGEYASVIEKRPEFALAQGNLAWVLATCPNDKLRDAPRALEHALKAVELTSGEDGEFLDTLAAAYANAGRFEDAVNTQRKALDNSAYRRKYLEEGKARVERYKQKKPFRTEPPKK